MKFLVFISSVVLAVSLSSCSVYMAAKGNDGVDPVELIKCKSRACLIAEGAKPVSQQRNKKGHVVSEVFYAKKPSGSSARAVMHGLLDVGTLGLWEVAGTPIEGAENRTDGYSIKAFYAQDQDTITSAKFYGG